MERNIHYLSRLFYPQSVAIVGAGDNPLAINGRIVTFMLRHKSRPRLLLINPKRDTIQGLTCYHQISDLPEVPDVAILVIGKQLVLKAIEELGENGCPFAIIVASGYAELGSDGKADQENIVRIARHYGMRLLGPNCVGVVNLDGPIILSWTSALERDPGDLLPGDVAMISQSGAMLSSLWDRATDFGVRFSSLVSTGNEADLEAAEFLEYFALDPKTKVISMYIEGLRYPENFLKAVDLAHQNNKAVVCYKVGRTSEGSLAASSHTGAITGSDETFDAMCLAHGIVRVSNLDALTMTTLALRSSAPAKGGRLGIFSSSGGAGGVISDKLKEKGLSIAQVSPEFERDMTEIMKAPPPHNPLDIARTPLRSLESIKPAIQRFVREETFDQIIIFMGVVYFQEVAPRFLLEGLKNNLDKPVLTCWMGGKGASKPSREMIEGGIPTFNDLESCLDAARALTIVGKYRIRVAKGLTPNNAPVGARERALSIIERCGRRLDEASSKEILALYGLSIPEGRLVKTLTEGKSVAGSLGFPVVVKGISPDVLHKTEAKAVCIRINDEVALTHAFEQVLAAIKVHGNISSCRGVLIEKMLPEPIAEVIIGSKFDEPSFHKIIFGLGGIWVEVMKDISVRIAPILRGDAEEMISEIRGARILDGLRGRREADKEAIIRALISLSTMVYDLHDQVKEIEVNPLMVFQKGAIAVDALMILR